jgi:hypothetical protein
VPLGFANPALYDMAGTSAFHDITSDPQGQGVTEAVAVLQSEFQTVLVLSTMGQCASVKPLTCGPGYSNTTGLGSPGPSFFTSFGLARGSGARPEVTGAG